MNCTHNTTSYHIKRTHIFTKTHVYAKNGDKCSSSIGWDFFSIQTTWLPFCSVNCDFVFFFFFHFALVYSLLLFVIICCYLFVNFTVKNVTAELRCFDTWISMDSFAAYNRMYSRRRGKFGLFLFSSSQSFMNIMIDIWDSDCEEIVGLFSNALELIRIRWHFRQKKIDDPVMFWIANTKKSIKGNAHFGEGNKNYIPKGITMFTSSSSINPMVCERYFWPSLPKLFGRFRSQCA